MDWYRDRYNPYSPPPPCWGREPPQYVPVPPGMDALKVAEFVERVHRRNALAEEKKNKNKKEDKKPSFKDEAIKYIQIAGILWFTAPLAVMAQHFITQWVTQVVK